VFGLHLPTLLPHSSGDIVSIELVDDFIFAIDASDTIFCACTRDKVQVDWEEMEAISACQLAISMEGNVAWRLTRYVGVSNFPCHTLRW
jgi:diketogulonate reductase-like aldo/keto reductase